MKAGQRLVLPNDVDELGLYVLEGELMAKESVIHQHVMAVIRTGDDIAVNAVRDTQFAIIGGERLSARHIWWNFVSSRKERIEQAKQAWLTGVFPKSSGDDVEFIPLPEK